MSKPLAERLSRFTPDGSRLDRDGLLFAAGRASVRPSRRWRVVAGVLAASQLLTLVFLGPATPHQGADAPRSPVAIESQAPAPAALHSWAMSRQFLDNAGDLPPAAGVDDLVPDDPPLRASSALTTILN